MNDCLFCRMAAGDIPVDAVYETDNVLVIRDINPQAETHLLLMPKKHVESLNDLEKAEESLLAELLRSPALIAQKAGIAQSGYRLVSNCGHDARQSVKHLHFHILGGQLLSDKMS